MIVDPGVPYIRLAKRCDWHIPRCYHGDMLAKSVPRGLVSWLCEIQPCKWQARNSKGKVTEVDIITCDNKHPKRISGHLQASLGVLVTSLDQVSMRSTVCFATDLAHG